MPTNQGTDIKETIFKNYGFTGSLDKGVITAETRAMNSPYTDPAILNFKWMIDWSKPYGLFADESNVDSALAYLKRIGEDTRYTLLQNFITKFKQFIQEYDFLILGVDGLAEIVNAKPHEMWRGDNDDKVTFTIRETVNLNIQGLITLYRQIWFDNVRGVEVLPANLRRFDCYVLVYNAGYYSMAIYDISGEESYENTTNAENLMFPTIKKLAKIEDSNISKLPFNNVLVQIQDASFSNEESGKSFFNELSNEMNADAVKNTIAISYRFANYSGIFYQLMGNYNFGDVLAIIATTSAQSNKSKNTFKDKMKQYFKDMGSEFKNQGKELGKHLKNTAITAGKSLISKNTPIGNALSIITDPTKIAGLVGDAALAGITSLEQKYVYGNIAKLQNMVSGNFSETMLTDLVLKGVNKIGKDKIETNINIPNDDAKVSTNMERLPEPIERDFKAKEVYIPEGIGKVSKGITYANENIYKRNTF